MDYEGEWKGRTYRWDGKFWTDVETFEVPPLAVVHKLSGGLLDNLRAEDEKITDPAKLRERASAAREAKQLARAEALARRVLALDGEDHSSAAILCSVLRERKRPQEALDETARYGRTDNPALLTSRAAALCDLERWEDAKREVGKALAITSGKKNHFALEVVARIKAERPGLYK